MNLSGDLVSKDCRAILLTNLRAVVHELGHAMHFLHTPHLSNAKVSGSRRVMLFLHDTGCLSWKP